MVQFAMGLAAKALNIYCCIEMVYEHAQLSHARDAQRVAGQAARPSALADLLSRPLAGQTG
jgi:hypothetical protein